ncbi:unnamed protein product [Closterium sp. Yama58-4]|nr:unnamed protein product [Closterium sp. Yama58-4]
MQPIYVFRSMHFEFPVRFENTFIEFVAFFQVPSPALSPTPFPLQWPSPSSLSHLHFSSALLHLSNSLLPSPSLFSTSFPFPSHPRTYCLPPTSSLDYVFSLPPLFSHPFPSPFAPPLLFHTFLSSPPPFPPYPTPFPYAPPSQVGTACSSTHILPTTVVSAPPHFLTSPLPPPFCLVNSPPPFPPTLPPYSFPPALSPSAPHSLPLPSPSTLPCRAGIIFSSVLPSLHTLSLHFHSRLASPALPPTSSLPPPLPFPSPFPTRFASPALPPLGDNLRHLCRI